MNSKHKKNLNIIFQRKNYTSMLNITKRKELMNSNYNINLKVCGITSSSSIKLASENHIHSGHSESCNVILALRSENQLLADNPYCLWPFPQ